MQKPLEPLRHFLRTTAPGWRLGGFLGILIGLWLPQVVMILVVTGWQPGTALSNTQNLWGAVALYLAIIVALQIFARWIDGQPFRYYGWALDRGNGFGLLLGLGLGTGSIAALYGIEQRLGWTEWTGKGFSWELLLEYAAIGLAIASIEELFFRGFLVNLWARRYGWGVGIGVSAVIFAVSHFIKPLAAILGSWPQFPGLLLMGLLLGMARWRSGDRLGLCIGLHGGWVWANSLVNVAGLISYTGTVPEIWTGLYGNPLAGVIGLFFLGVTGLMVWPLAGFLARNTLKTP
jgi:uncharacterized protein